MQRYGIVSGAMAGFAPTSRLTQKPSPVVGINYSVRKPVEITMTFDEWWEKNEAQYSSDACHMSEYHMASVVWNAALATRPEAAPHDFGPTRRWNIEERDGEVYICKGEHDAYAACRFEHYVRDMNEERS